MPAVFLEVFDVSVGYLIYHQSKWWSVVLVSLIYQNTQA